MGIPQVHGKIFPRNIDQGRISRAINVSTVKINAVVVVQTVWGGLKSAGVRCGIHRPDAGCAVAEGAPALGQCATVVVKILRE